MNTVTWVTVNWFWFATLLIMGTGATQCPADVDYMDTGQLQNFLAVEATVDGIQVNLRGGELPYCSNLTAIMCTIKCTVNFTTIHSPSYSINEHCYSAAGDGEDLKEIVVNATSNHPFYTIYFQCSKIAAYRCVMNSTLHTQKISVQPDAAACGTRDPPTNTTLPDSSDGGNATNGTTIIPWPPHGHGELGPITVGMAFLVLLILGIATILSIILAAVINYRQHLRTQGLAILRRICPHCSVQNAQHDIGDEVNVPIPVVDSESESEMVPGLSLSVEGGEGVGQQRPISVTRPTC